MSWALISSALLTVRHQEQGGAQFLSNHQETAHCWRIACAYIMHFVGSFGPLNFYVYAVLHT